MLLIVCKVCLFYTIVTTFDGSNRNSTVVIMVINHKNQFVTVMPNPFVDKLRVKINSTIQGKARLTISDLSGRKLLTKNITVIAGITNVDIDETEGFSNGNYLLNIITEKQ